MRVLEERGVKTESGTSGKQINLVYFLFWTSTYELLCIVALFWTDILPWYGDVDSIKNFGKRYIFFNCRPTVFSLSFGKITSKMQVTGCYVR